MAEVLLIDLTDIPDKWNKLMLHIANQPETVVKCRFLDEATARMASNGMRAAAVRRPSWFNLLIAARGADVYVVKVGKAKKVVVR